MSFDPTKLFLAAGRFNSTSYGAAPAIHTYNGIEEGDDIETIATPGYFPDFFGADADEIRADDILIVLAADIRIITLVVSVDPVILTTFTDFPTNLVTQDLTSQAQEYLGIWASSIPIIIDIAQQGNECLVTFPSAFDTSTGGPSISLFAAIFPANRPLYDFVTPFEIMNNGVSEMGHIEIKTDGTMKIFRLDAAAFSVGGNAGFPTQPVKYRTV